MTGGDEGFGAGGWIGSPVEEIMPVTFEIKHKRVHPARCPGHHHAQLRDPQGQLLGHGNGKEVGRHDQLAGLHRRARLFLVAGRRELEVPLQLNTNKEAVKKKIVRMQIGDMPDFDSTMRMAFKELTTGRGRDAAQKHVIIMSDGDANAPSPKLLADYKKEKISVSTIALGWGMHVMANTLQDIARKTGASTTRRATRASSRRSSSRNRRWCGDR